MTLAPGTMVNANVRLVELLGKGGMGSVWLADHLGLEARVAVKFIAPHLIDREPTLRERFKREASICARIRSIHAVQTFDHGMMDDGVPYIVMELLEGTNLTDRIENEGELSVRETSMMVAQVSKVLHRAHVLGIVHRDVKPDNIFLTEDDYDMFVKVLDFGIAKETRLSGRNAAVTKTGAIVGTPEFMSPEQAISSKDIDYRADLFSLAVVAYYSLTRDLPWDLSEDDDIEPMWMQMSSGRHVKASERNPNLADALDLFFDKALQPRPDDRFQSARDMANAFVTIANATETIVDEFSSLDDSLSLPLRRPNQDNDDSHPAMYDLLGPESDDYGSEATVLMNEMDHEEAEVVGEEPPTQRRPSLSKLRKYALSSEPEAASQSGASNPDLPSLPSMPGPLPAPAPPSQAAFNAVRMGAYNMGNVGAYNAVVAGKRTPSTPPDAKLAKSELPPWALTDPGTMRRRVPVALIVVVAASAIIAIIAALLSLST